MTIARLARHASTLAVAILIAGCADQPPPPPVVTDSPQPKVVTDLSTLSSVPIEPLHPEAMPTRGSALLQSNNSDPNSPRTFLAQPGFERAVGTDKDPGVERLLNDKAAKFANFSQVILERIFSQMRLAEKTEEISRLKLPTDIKPVIITAIMDKNGKLTELVVEQHSGKAVIDKMMLDVCKKAIWYRNPPPAALSGDGNYKFTIDARLENYATSDAVHWNFITHIGLGIG
ncbi:MAG TPA: hypothetical protein VEU51_11575 [Candidatus Acidoferrales bacterium]|nr:hypothetical protein [Candidatus Acidoferrales bacterium]